jgi:hypothetical protein
MFELAQRTASVVRRQVGSEDHAHLSAAMFRRVLGREPTADENSAAVKFMSQPSGAIESSLDARALWSYGTAKIDDRDQVTEFTPLTVFADDRWQAGSKFPTDPPLGYAFLASENAHTPTDTQMAVVRRFTAPFSGKVQLRGQLGHRSEDGDGIRASIWVGGQRMFTETEKMNDRPYGPIRGQVQSGQTIDFVASAGGSDSFDSFYWRVHVRLTGSDGKELESDSTKHFSGPYDRASNQPLDRLAQLAQTLLMSNEFAFVD